MMRDNIKQKTVWGVDTRVRPTTIPGVVQKQESKRSPAEEVSAAPKQQTHGLWVSYSFYSEFCSVPSTKDLFTSIYSSSSNESPPPEPKAAEFKSLSHIVIPGTAEFEQAGDSKYLTMAGLGLKQEKEEQKFTDAKYQNGSSSAPAGEKSHFVFDSQIPNSSDVFSMVIPSANCQLFHL